MAKPKRKTDVAEVTPIKETKEQVLQRLAAKRVEKACKAISLVGNLAAYRPTAAQIEQIGEALVDSVNAVQARLTGGRKDSYTFTLNK